jgi:hypothetical protein
MTIGIRRTAAVATCLLLAGSQLDGGTAAGAQEAGVSADYQCQFPGGAQKVPVQVTGTFPDGTSTGTQLQPGTVTTELTVPHAAVADLTGLGAATVGGKARLTTAVTRNGTASSQDWPGSDTAPVTIPDQGDLTLRFTQTPSPTAGSDSAVTFAAGQIALTLTPKKADGSATSPDTLAITCTPPGGKASALATVAAAAAAQPRATTYGVIPDHCLDDVSPPGEVWGQGGCVYFSGFSNVQKQDAAMQLNDGSVAPPALATLRYHFVVDADQTSHIDARFKLLGPIVTRSAFLTFNLMPITATVEMTQQGIGTERVKPIPGTQYNAVEAHMRVSIRVSDVSVNGTTLAVGDNCHSSSAADITLHDLGNFSNITAGGPLHGYLTIPTFTGCGTNGEDLTPIFDGTISGSGNYLKIVQGALCTKSTAARTCPPKVPAPQR